MYQVPGIHLPLDISSVVITDPTSMLMFASGPTACRGPSFLCVGVVMQRDYASLHLAASGTSANPSSVRGAGAAMSTIGELTGKRNQAGCPQVTRPFDVSSTRIS